ncbi:MAG: B12-binding domain-containing radical SAM protein [Promethearchaeota archaeon]
MDVLLVNPPTYNGMGYLKAFRIQEMPMSLAYLAAVIEKRGHNVRILDMNMVPSKQDFYSKAREFNYQVIGFTATTSIIKNCFTSIKILKKIHPHAKVVLGGWHATALPLETMESCLEIDFIVKGEGEVTFDELVEKIDAGTSTEDIKGLVYRESSGNIIVNEDRELVNNLDEIPYPARHLLPMDEYRKMGLSYIVYDLSKLKKHMKDGYPVVTHILTSRGCYNRCTFCADHLIYRQRCRFHSAEYVIGEIKHCITEFNARIFNIMDPVFLLNQRRVRDICKLILKEGIDIQWCCQGRVNNNLSVGLLKLMKRAGCQKIYYGIESGSPRMLKIIGKNINIDQIKDTTSKTRLAGIPFHVFFLYGFPEETMQDFRQTWQLIKEIEPDNIEVHRVIPLPGTDLFARLMERHALDEKDWSRFHYYAKNENYVSITPARRKEKKRVEALFYSLSKKYNLSFRYIKNILKRVNSIDYILSYIKGLKTVAEYLLFVSRKVN